MENHIISGQDLNSNEKSIGNSLEDFEILQTLGKGSYGFVAKVKSKIDQKLYAMKMIDFSLINEEEEKQLSMNEIEIIKSLDSPHIIKYYNKFWDGQKLYILMEFINNGDIKGYIAAHQNMGAPIEVGELWELFYQCMSGLCCIHKNHLIHRDIKPANLFLTDDKTIKIGDFGVSASRKKTQTKFSKETIMIGTPLYMSPEMFNHEEYGSKVDVYSLGCTFYEMCYFTPPRIPIPTMNLNLEIRTELQDIPKKFNKDKYPREITYLLEMMIQKDKTKRPSSAVVFNYIKTEYNKYNSQNSSINAVLRCLFSLQNFMAKILKIQQSKDKPITLTIFNGYKNINNNWTLQLQIIRDILTYYNTCFIDPGEIEPIDIVDYLIKTIHIENNKIPNKYSRIYTKEDDNDIYNRDNIFKKYLANFQNTFKSCVSDQFFGTLEIQRRCCKCNQMRFYFENFYYLTINVKQAIKNGLNIKQENFLFSCFQKQNFSNINGVKRFCPNCQKLEEHMENQKILILPDNLIIYIKNIEENSSFSDKESIEYPINVDFSNLQLISGRNFILKGVIKRLVSKGKSTFDYINDDGNKHWISNICSNYLPSPKNHYKGIVEILFYSSVN